MLTEKRSRGLKVECVECWIKGNLGIEGHVSVCSCLHALTLVPLAFPSSLAEAYDIAT